MSQLSLDAVVWPHRITGPVCIRPAKASDVEGLSIYFTGLSSTSRNVAMADHPGHFTLLAELRQEEGPGTIIGETRYAYDAAARYGDFAISVADMFQRKSVGLQMMNAMERQAGDLGHEMIAAETARANVEMRGLAKKAGYEDSGLGDWFSVHLAKRLLR